MPEPHRPEFADPNTAETRIAILPIAPQDMEAVLAAQPAPARGWAQAQGFAATLGETCPLPDGEGGIGAVLLGLGTPSQRARKRFALGAAVAKLPKGVYRLAEGAGLDASARMDVALGYLLAQYRFYRYCARPPATARLVAPEGIDGARLTRLARAEFLARDLINTPANDMGPEELEQAAAHLAQAKGAKLRVIRDGDLLAQNLPLIHAVGRASPRRPRLIDLTWDNRPASKGPSVTIVGKGVCFDTGGLNLKPAASMGTMKKDMGGAAHALALAQAVIEADLPLALRVLIPAVENAVDGNAFRPGDILTARNGLSVEINNTDAEGRLVLADALALAGEDQPDLMISLATLTGAARVAVGPDLAPFFTDDEALAAELMAASGPTLDPLWRLPFHAPYETMIEPGIADLDNAPSGGMAGAITAALFLRRFAGGAKSYVHFDIYAWQAADAPARPKGGLAQSLRALCAVLEERGAQ